MRKVIVFLLVCAGAFSLLPVSYASLTGRWRTSPMVRAEPLARARADGCEVAFTWVDACDNEVEKDVGQIVAHIVDGGKGIVVGMTNAYPGYMAYVSFLVKNVGQVPVKITRVKIDNSHPQVLQVRINRNHLVGGVLDPGSFRTGLLSCRIKKAAAMNATYHFTAEIRVVQAHGGGPGP